MERDGGLMWSTVDPSPLEVETRDRLRLGRCAALSLLSVARIILEEDLARTLGAWCILDAPVVGPRPLVAAGTTTTLVDGAEASDSSLLVSTSSWATPSRRPTACLAEGATKADDEDAATVVRATRSERVDRCCCRLSGDTGFRESDSDVRRETRDTTDAVAGEEFG